MGTLARRPTVARDLVEAARALMWETGAPVFTVNQVVAAAGTSLKSFYRCFESKDELLVALFEDDARRGAEALAAAVDGHDDPVARVRCAVEGLFGFITVDGRLPYAAALVPFIGEERIVWGSDYPHHDATFPGACLLYTSRCV